MTFLISMLLGRVFHRHVERTGEESTWDVEMFLPGPNTHKEGIAVIGRAARVFLSTGLEGTGFRPPRDRVFDERHKHAALSLPGFLL
jgi:hypothetical protein